MYDFAKKIGGDKVEVINLVPAGTEPHDWEPSTKDLIEMEKSDIFIYNGAGMEQWVDDVLESLDTEELTSVEASKGIKLLKDQDAHEHDHEHNSENDPHVWLDPQNAKYEMNKIKKALIKVDAENKDYYEANYKRYAKECDKLDTLYKEETSKLTKKELVVAHEAFGYLCHAYGLEQMGIEGLSADDEPPKKQKVLVGIILAAVACTLVISGGTTAIKGMINLNGLLQSVVMILCAVAFFKSGKKEDNEHVD